MSMTIGAVAGDAQMPNRRPFAIGAALLLIAAPGQLAVAHDLPAQPGSCVRTRSIDDWKPIDLYTVIVSTAPNAGYRVKFFGPCYHMKWSVFDSVSTRPTGATPCLSPGDVFVFGRGPTLANGHFEEEERCTVRSFVPVKSAELASQSPRR